MFLMRRCYVRLRGVLELSTPFDRLLIHSFDHAIASFYHMYDVDRAGETGGGSSRVP